MGNWRPFLARNALGLVGLSILALAVAGALAAPHIAPYSPTSISLMARMKPPAWIDGGSFAHPLGTDNLGRDILSRVIYGSRISLAVGFAAVLLGALIGSTVGILAGYFGGWVDSGLSFLIDVQLSFPFTLLAIFLLATFGGGFWPVVLVLALATWVNYARVVRGKVMSVKGQDYVHAAHTVGVPTLRILTSHILPNTVSPIIVVASFSMAQAILTEAALSFLGVGVDGSNPSWGTMLNDGRSYLQSAWWLTAMPGIAIALTVLGGNLCGDWLQDRLDPRSAR
ncbi:peptide ABC transporter permease [Aureimonas sp. Leaf454]|uniref:ABC transporter permease n=1 Tax=Aureimonas sp. Leaf454 TaxID=1736381 RepID=UPI0006F5A534|nr:ABC transporter permease [Aureimonas sp. Leaf454]KQT46346.1 peptide ABC transporter permease [Aureimonas sp. Leaf454]